MSNKTILEQKLEKIAPSLGINIPGSLPPTYPKESYPVLDIQSEEPPDQESLDMIPLWRHKVGQCIQDWLPQEM